MAREFSVRDCACAACQAGDHPEKEDHRYLHLIFSRLDEQQRRWVAGREARRRGHGGIQQVAEITGCTLKPFASVVMNSNRISSVARPTACDFLVVDGHAWKKRSCHPERPRSADRTGNRRQPL